MGSCEFDDQPDGKCHGQQNAGRNQGKEPVRANHEEELFNLDHEVPSFARLRSIARTTPFSRTGRNVH